MTARTQPEFRQVYFIEAETLGMVKIGVADDARRRLSTLQTASPVRLKLLGVHHVDDGPGWEKRLHKQFAAMRVHGEWFRLIGELAEYVAETLFGPDEGHIRLCIKPQPYVEPVARWSSDPSQSYRANRRSLQAWMDEQGIPK